MKLVVMKNVHSGREVFMESDAGARFAVTDQNWKPDRETEGCGYLFDGGWTPNRCGASVPCAKHSDERCWCGASAVAGCPDAGGFICGMPVCAEHRACRRHIR